MSHVYVPISWNRQKRFYDSMIASGIVLYLGLFAGIGAFLYPDATAETLLIRGLGTGAFLMLHVILCMGPLARLSPRFLPLLYNRRHLGVSMFFVALAHGVFSLIQFHALGNVNPLVSLLSSNPRYDSLANFPFELLGLIALLILFLMAATSHDFWLTRLTAPVWKRLHMLVYLAYGLIVAHILLGVLQYEMSPVLSIILAAGITLVVSLHLIAGARERRLDIELHSNRADGFVDVCSVKEIPNFRARIATVAGERVAIFKYDGRISAVSNVCRHQNGPLGEGRILDGCITCPWHGYQYLPDSGASPPPFKEKVPTFNVKIVNDRVLVLRRPNPPGYRVEPATIDNEES